MTERRHSDVGDSVEEPALDLTPRDTDVSGSRRGGLLPKVLLAGVVVALGFVLLQTLGDAALFFYNADEATERRDELLDQRFRVQGTPFGEPVSVDILVDGSLEAAVVFPIAFDGTIVDVVHVGAPAELFQPNVPVVLEGTWVQGLPDGIDSVEQGANDGWHFASTEMVVKHDNEYRNDNQERLDEAEQRGFSPEP